ncbi:uncharacterized protein LOC135487082 [Lineus longissimus]|uniref:uncharacterized protein LOC135487082 n=1 Tax=Lineus longissimus TaxID=88925 RepID=UPI00315CDC6E
MTIIKNSSPSPNTSSASAYHSDPSSILLSESPSSNSRISWRFGGNPVSSWQTTPQITQSTYSQLACDSGAFESDAGSSTTDAGWYSETSDPTDDSCCGQEFENSRNAEKTLSENVIPCQSPKSSDDITAADIDTSDCIQDGHSEADDRNDSVTAIFRKNFARRRPRKQSRPEKSARRFDPGFKGVVLKFKTKLDSLNCRYKLRIRSYYSCHRRTRNCRYHRHDSRRTFLTNVDSTSSSDSDVDLVVSKKNKHRQMGKTGKQCASCGTKKTPLWRDAEDGTPLCNACGIRYKKYRIRCSYCWYVPRKAGKSCPICSSCGERVQLSHGRKMSTYVFVTKFGKFYKKQM